ncbi:MAG TPA: acyl-ACP thioesterase domain-containing protein [Gaiellaceae bacterium]|nr:acyl-ACP thioesterase domain-containing protein [Gaiellaceae bacterium]
MEPLVPIPTRGRVFTDRRRIRLSDRDGRGRLRLDGVARFLQDVAIDDVEQTGWGLPAHLWFVRSIRIDVMAPFRADREVALSTWCSGTAAIAAGRRWSLTGDAGGRIEVDSVWIHLGPDQTPARIEGFGVYEEATDGRRVSTKLELPDPETGSSRAPWTLRAADVDMHGHVNNAVYWQAVEEALLDAGPDPARPLRALLDFRRPIDLVDRVELATARADGVLALGFVVDGDCRAVARVSALAEAA